MLFHQKARNYWSDAIASCPHDPRALWSKINKLCGPPSAPQIQYTASDLASHFVGKVEKIKASTVDAETLHITTRPGTVLSQFQPITAPDAVKLLMKSPTKHCALDPALTWLIKRAANVLAPVTAAVCNASLEAGILPTSQKQAVVTARLKKPSLNPDDLNSYRPISNLSFLSKLIERAVASQYMAHSDSNHLLPPRQSAYRRRFSTETAVLLVYNDIIRAVC